MKIVIAGGRGFIGRAIATYFKEHQLIILSRTPNQGHYWNPDARQIAPHLMDGADVVINLAGESILGRWNQDKIERMRESRFKATNFLTELMKRHPPKLYLGASGMGYYGDRGQELLTEKSPSGHSYLAEICRIWEQIPKQLTEVRQVYMRFGLILGQGGALAKMLPLFKLGLGGILGDGSQIMSWMAINDVCGAIKHIINHSEISGPVNFVAPQTVTNKEFTKTLGRVLRRPTFFGVPKWALKMLYGAGQEVFLTSLNLTPKVLLDSGYQFQYPQLENALRSFTK